MAENPLCAQERAALAECIRRGDGQAEQELAALYWERAYVMALVRTKDRDAACDLANEILLAVVLALRKGQLRQPESVSAFVHGTARNLINNYLRFQSQRREEPISSEPVYTPPDGAEQTERRRMVRHGLQNLEPKDREILLLTLVEGLTPGKIAERLHLTPGAVRARKSRALKKVTTTVQKMVTKQGWAATISRGLG